MQVLPNGAAKGSVVQVTSLKQEQLVSTSFWSFRFWNQLAYK